MKLLTENKTPTLGPVQGWCTSLWWRFLSWAVEGPLLFAPQQYWSVCLMIVPANLAVKDLEQMFLQMSLSAPQKSDMQ